MALGSRPTRAEEDEAFRPGLPSGGFDPASALSLLKDAGAGRDDPAAPFAGLAERVDVDLALGEAATRVPIELPPGRKGMTPVLALRYGSRAGNGLVGRGWDLPLPRITRSTRWGVPVEYDEPGLPYPVPDAGTLPGPAGPAGAGEYVVELPSGTVTLDQYLGVDGGLSFSYGTSAEEGFLRARFTPLANVWIVTDKSGVQYAFGTVGAQSRTGANVFSATGTFAWGLTSITDSSGNRISVEYQSYGVSDPGNAALYPARVHYGYNASAGYTDRFHVCFAYDAAGTNCNATPPVRPDPQVTYLGGFAAALDHRLTGIKVWADGESTETAPTRRYALQYTQDALTAESQLQRVDLYGKDGSTLRPATFTYSASAAGLATQWTAQGFQSGSWRTREPLRANINGVQTVSDLIDMTGDGRPDWVECSATSEWYVYRNLGNGQFGARETWMNAGAPNPGCGFHTTFTDLIDLNGDALPDAVNAAGFFDWTVFINTGSGFEGPVWSWKMPVDYLEDHAWVVPVNPTNGFGGTKDLNGDGLPDLIDQLCDCPTSNPQQPGYCLGTEGYCRVHFNTGSGFDPEGTLWSWPLIDGEPAHTTYTGLSDTTYSALLDLTGDGLPDLIDAEPEPPAPAGHWAVYVNTGRGFSLTAAYWRAPIGGESNGPMRIGEPCQYPGGWPPIGLQGALRDVTGDGLPDYVDADVDCDFPDQGGPWRVFVNTGAGFRDTNADGIPDPITWTGTAGLLVERWGDLDGVRVVVGDTLDLNGDGVAEYVEGRIGDPWNLDVRAGLGSPPGLLTRQDNGLGGSVQVSYVPATAIEPYSNAAAQMCFGGSRDGQVCTYPADCPDGGSCAPCTDCGHAPFPFVVVKDLTTASGFGGPGTGHTLTTSYRYLAPYFDWEERAFRGFRWAVEMNTDASRRREIEFVQPGDDPREAVTACGAPSQTCTALAAARPFKGKPRYTRTRHSGGPEVFREETTEWQTRAVTPDPRLPAAGLTTTAVARESRTRTEHGSQALGGGPTSLQSREAFAYDAYNNVASVARWIVGAANPTSTTTTTYEYNSTQWIVDRPATVEVSEPGTALARQGFDYDSRGNVTAIWDWLDTDPLGGSVPRLIPRATIAYTGAAGLAGQPTAVTDARGHTTTLGYAAGSCDTFGLVPCSITNAKGHQTSRTYQLEFGAVITETDPNGAITRSQYDAFGRVTEVYRPLEVNQDPQTLLPWRRFRYILGTAAPLEASRIETDLREPWNAEEYRTQVQFFDGLGRALETKADNFVDGVAEVTVSGAVGFDAAGRVAKRYAPFAAGAGLTAYEAPPPTGAFTQTVFDALDRPTEVTRPDGINRAQTYYDPAGVTETRDENYIACDGGPGPVPYASCPGKRTVETRDALGRVTRMEVTEGSTTTVSDTTNTYDGLDRLRTTRDTSAANTTVTFTYDSVSRRIAVADPDSGTWRSGYDDTGTLVYQDDPALNQHLEFCPDELNRPTRKLEFTTDAYSGDACANGVIRATYGYDTCTVGTGRLCREYAPNRFERTLTYDARGRVRDEMRAITAGGQTRSFTQQFTYDDIDRLNSVRYPTDVDGTFEILSYLYNSVGQLVSASTPGNVYLSNTTYDRFGRLREASLAGGAVVDRREYLDATSNFRLKHLAVIRGSTTLQSFRYDTGGIGAYDRAGNLLAVDDVTPVGYVDDSVLDNDWLYTYDGVGRLQTAKWGAKPTTASFGYDTLGNLTSGNLAFPDLTTATAVTFAISGTRRHHVASAAPPGGGSPFLYESGGQNGDGNGGLAYRPATVAGDTAKVVAYDIEGRAVAMNVGGQTIESVYDDGGRRIARIVNSTEQSFFFGRYFEVHGGQLVRHIYAGDRRIAFSPIAAPPSLTLAALADDHPAVLLARAGREAAWLNDLPPLTDAGRPVQAAGAVVLGAGLLLLAVLPAGRGRPRRFGRLRRGRVILVVVLYVTALPDWSPPLQIPHGAGVASACPLPPPSYPAYLVHTDHLGSTTMLTAFTVSGQTDGAVMQYVRYGPYGTPQAYQPDGAPVVSGAALTEHTYTGQRWDAAAQLYDYGARFYDPRIGRFLTTDPAREYMNPYAYVRWNPVRFVDPTGMFSLSGLALYFGKGGQQGADFANLYAGMTGGYAQEGRAGMSAALSAVGAAQSAEELLSEIGQVEAYTQTTVSTPPALDSFRASASTGAAPAGVSSGTSTPEGSALSAGGGSGAGFPDALGISVELSAIVPFYGSNSGGTIGYNLQFGRGGITGLYFYASKAGEESVGLNIGAAVQYNAAWGSGPWSGDFVSVEAAAGPYSGGVFSSMGAAPGEGYVGVAGGVGWGLPGVSGTILQYSPIWGGR